LDFRTLELLYLRKTTQTFNIKIEGDSLKSVPTAQDREFKDRNSAWNGPVFWSI